MHALILGGSGFIGSSVADVLCASGAEVTVLDGLMEKTGGRKQNVTQLLEKICFIESPIEYYDELESILNTADIIIDSMAWTAHHAALSDPFYDLKLNLKAHIFLLEKLKKYPGKRIIYLASRGQYGNPPGNLIVENTPSIPVDIQGINKLAAEHYFRVYTKLYGFHVISVRFGNTFGPRQPVSGSDIGLIGDFMRKAIEGGTIEVYGKNRRRPIIYVADVAEVIFRLAFASFEGFSILNIPGMNIPIGEIAKRIVQIAGSGTIVEKDIPPEIQAIDSGNAAMRSTALQDFVGNLRFKDLNTALRETLSYFQSQVGNH